MSLSAVFPEMWRPFDSSKTWPMCIFYRNPGARASDCEGACLLARRAPYNTDCLDAPNPPPQPTALDPRVYTACRSEINSVYGDHTSPRQVKTKKKAAPGVCGSPRRWKACVAHPAQSMRLIDVCPYYVPRRPTGRPGVERGDGGWAGAGGAGVHGAEPGGLQARCVLSRSEGDGGCRGRDG